MYDETDIRKFSPREIIVAASLRMPVVDPRKSLEELTFPELLLLEQNPDELHRYNRERLKLLQQELQQVEETLDDAPIDALLKELYDRT